MYLHMYLHGYLYGYLYSYLYSYLDRHFSKGHDGGGCPDRNRVLDRFGQSVVRVAATSLGSR